MRDGTEYVAYPEVHPSGRADLKVRVERKYQFAYLGRIEPEKGVEDLLFAAEKCGIRVTVAGDCASDYVAYLKRRYGHVADFVGRVESSAFLAEVAVLVVPSQWLEPFGRVVVEGALAGSQLIVADAPGLCEAAYVTQADVVFYDRGNRTSLVNAICDVLERSAIEAASTFHGQAWHTGAVDEYETAMQRAIESSSSRGEP